MARPVIEIRLMLSPGHDYHAVVKQITDVTQKCADTIFYKSGSPFWSDVLASLLVTFLQRHGDPGLAWSRLKARIDLAVGKSPDAPVATEEPESRSGEIH